MINNKNTKPDTLKETVDVLKKDPGIDQKALKNREKAVIVDALKDRYLLPAILWSDIIKVQSQSTRK